MGRRGQPYVLGAKVNIANENWSGPWDCAEFVSWACYHAYKCVFAVRPPDVRVGESYSGWWFEDAVARNAQIPAAQAVRTEGAILIRRPGDAGRKIGHVAISRGDGTTIEAHSTAVGVDVINDAGSRPWTCGAFIPGVKYGAAGGGISVRVPRGLLQLANPFMRGDNVEKLQQALKAQGIDPGPVDGIFGPATATAVAGFQALKGLVVDGIVGPQTSKALGL